MHIFYDSIRSKYKCFIFYSDGMVQFS